MGSSVAADYASRSVCWPIVPAVALVPHLLQQRHKEHDAVDEVGFELSFDVGLMKSSTGKSVVVLWQRRARDGEPARTTASRSEQQEEKTAEGIHKTHRPVRGHVLFGQADEVHHGGQVNSELAEETPYEGLKEGSEKDSICRTHVECRTRCVRFLFFPRTG